jgi:Protein of unknown function (DUF2716)
VVHAAWEQIPSENYEDFWGPFDARFSFRPSMWQHPGIEEPAPSITMDLAPIFAGTPAEFAAGENAVNALALVAMTRAFTAAERLVVLDWQHTSWWFRPRLHAITDDQQWPIPVFPNGDYYVFLTEDMSTGTFGHPWEQTFCIWGRLMPVLAPMLSAWLPVKRSK